MPGHVCTQGKGTLMPVLHAPAKDGHRVSSPLHFMHIPKTGGESMEAFFRAQKDHTTAFDNSYGAPMTERRFVFTIVRNPYDRLYSWFRFCVHGWMKKVPAPPGACVPAISAFEAAASKIEQFEQKNGHDVKAAGERAQQAAARRRQKGSALWGGGGSSGPAVSGPAESRAGKSGSKSLDAEDEEAEAMRIGAWQGAVLLWLQGLERFMEEGREPPTKMFRAYSHAVNKTTVRQPGRVYWVDDWFRLGAVDYLVHQPSGLFSADWVIRFEHYEEDLKAFLRCLGPPYDGMNTSVHENSSGDEATQQMRPGTLERYGLFTHLSSTKRQQAFTADAYRFVNRWFDADFDFFGFVREAV